ncbi:MAG: glycoside-pentoside-hexuronide (GPH):cation symporter [Erysipelotrichaceae bacterium]|nr:glycoside-pentoside-hexuronide (GPH):cation symporter [Erysipelotrichaceae bacterium]
MEKEKNKLKLKHKIGYGLGDAGGVMTFALMSSTFSMYCTDALGISPGTIAILLLIWNIWDFINDPLMGAYIDRSYAKNNDPKGKFRPWILKSAPLLCVSFIALWSVPSLFEGMARLCLLFGLKILYEGSYTMFNIPMGSLLSAMADNDEDRAALSSARGVGSAGATLISLFIMPLFLKKYGESNAIGYAIGAAACALIGLAMCMAHYFMTEERIDTGAGSKGSDNIRLTDILEVVKVNRPFVALCVHGLFICMMQYVGNTLNNYMYADVLGDISISAYGTLLSAPAMIIIFITGPMIAKRIGLEKLIRYGLLISCILYVALYGALMLFDVNPWVYAVCSNTAMGFAFISIYMQWGLVGEAIDYNEMITGKRTEASIYGTFNLSRRVGQTIGNSAAMLLLGLVGYNGALAAQSASTVNGIKTLCVLLPGILVLGSWASFKFLWNMDEKMRARVDAYKASKKG